jgi:hypothetical protein
VNKIELLLGDVFGPTMTEIYTHAAIFSPVALCQDIFLFLNNMHDSQLFLHFFSKATKMSRVKEKNRGPWEKREEQRSRVKESNRGSRVKERNRGSQVKDSNRGSRVKDSNKGYQVKERNRGSQVKERNRGSQVKERNRGLQVKERNRGSQVKERNRGTQVKERNRGSQVKERNRGSWVKKRNRGTLRSERNRGSQVREEQRVTGQRGTEGHRSKRGTEGHWSKRGAYITAVAVVCSDASDQAKINRSWAWTSQTHRPESLTSTDQNQSHTQVRTTQTQRSEPIRHFLLADTVFFKRHNSSMWHKCILNLNSAMCKTINI